MSSRYDLCLVHSDDADQWSRYVVHHLGREHFRFRLVSVTDRQLVGWLTAARGGDVGATSCVGEVSDARSFIVVVSPGLVQLMVQQPLLDFDQLVKEPRTAQVSGVIFTARRIRTARYMMARCLFVTSRCSVKTFELIIRT